MLTEIVVSSIRSGMKKARKRYRKWKGVQDEFTDLNVSRQRKWQLRMRKEGKCGICARPFGEDGCPSHPSYRPIHKRKHGIIGPCIANMLRAGMTIDEIVEDMNTTRRNVFQVAYKQGIDIRDQHRPGGRLRIHPKAPKRKRGDLNLRIFLKESLNGNATSPLQTPATNNA